MKSRQVSNEDKKPSHPTDTGLEDRGSSGDPQARIARRAYELYEQRGREDGHDLDDWIEAKRQIHQQSA